MRRQLRNILGIALSIGLLWWTLRDVRLDQVWGRLATSNLPMLVLGAVVVGTLIFPLRALRWRVILSPIEPSLPLGMLWRATAIGMMVNNVIPARAGEFARAYALSRETRRVPFSSAFASLAVDRVFDAVVVLLLMLVAMFDPAFPSDNVVGGQRLANWVGGGTLVVVAALTALYLIVFFPQRIVGMYARFARRISPRLEDRGRDALLAFAAGLGVLRNPARFATVLLWTTAHWLLNALAFWIGFKAVGMDVGYSAALMLQGIIAIGVAVPSAPGFFGIFEALAKAGLPIYGVSAELAVSWAIGYHLLSFVPITLIGAFYFARMGLHFRELRQDTDSDAPSAASGSAAVAGAAPGRGGAPAQPAGDRVG